MGSRLSSAVVLGRVLAAQAVSTGGLLTLKLILAVVVVLAFWFTFWSVKAFAAAVTPCLEAISQMLRALVWALTVAFMIILAIGSLLILMVC